MNVFGEGSTVSQDVLEWIVRCQMIFSPLGILFFGYFYFFFLGFRVIWHKIVFFCLIHLNNGWILSIHFFVIPLLLIYSSVIYYDILEKKIIVLMNIFLETILHFMLFITGIWKPALKVAKEGKTLIRNDWK